MKFEEVLPALRAGKKARRACWAKESIICIYGQLTFTLADSPYHPNSYVMLEANDWEIIAEPKRVATYLVPEWETIIDWPLEGAPVWGAKK